MAPGAAVLDQSTGIDERQTVPYLPEQKEVTRLPMDVGLLGRAVTPHTKRYLGCVFPARAGASGKLRTSSRWRE